MSYIDNPGVTDHGLLTGLTDDDHTQYLLADGSRALQPTVDSTTAWQILDADGGTPIFNVDSTNERIGIGTASPSNILDIAGASPTFRMTPGTNSQTVSLLMAAADGTTRGGFTTNLATGEIRIGALSGSGYFPTFYAQGVEAMRIVASTRNVGIGTTTPQSKLVVSTASAGAVAAATTFDDMVVENSSHGGISVLTPNGMLGALAFGSPSDNDRVQFGRESSSGGSMMTGSSGYEAVMRGSSGLLFGIDTSIKMKIDEDGNVGIGTTSPGGSSTVGAGVLSLANQTPPVGGVANQVSIFSADVAASAELHALDEAGNTPTLSPHSVRVLNRLPVKATGPYAYPWAESSKNPYLGIQIDVDMAGVVEAIEQLAGKSFTTITPLPPEERLDWDTGQEIQRQRRQEEIDRVNEQRAELDAQIVAESDAEKVLELEKRRDEIAVPSDYQKKRPPAWMVNRGVRTAIAED